MEASGAVLIDGDTKERRFKKFEAIQIRNW
jgi:hypothetical protein